MKKLFAVAAVIFSTGAFAAQTNTGCQGNCPGGDTINNQGGIGYGGAGGIGLGGTGIGVGGSGGAGGQGGAGGAGGSASATGGSGGSVTGSGNSSNHNDVNQGQSQGQHQSANSNQSQSSRNDNKSQASNANSNASQGNTTSVQVAGDTVTYQAPKIPVATAYAPNIAPTALCALGVSAGGTGMSFGFSIGGSYIDTNCQNLEQVRTAAAVLGDRETAAEMMCGISDAYREARERSGKPCGKAIKFGAATESDHVAKTASIEYTDPIVRARLGLPPLK